MHTFASVAVVDSRGWVLMEQRDEHALHDPERWGLPGGDLEDCEDFRAAAARELAEETGLEVAPDRLESLGTSRFRSESCGGEDRFELFAVRLDVSDEDVVCGEGRDVAFVDPATFDDLDLHQAARLAIPLVRAWHRSLDGSAPLFVLLAVADAGGRLLMQERDEHAPYSPHRWCLPGGGIETGETPHAAAVRELAEETGLTGIEVTEIATTRRFHPLMGWNDFVTFGALTDLRDDDVECREGRQMVFRDPEDLAALALTDSTALVLPEVLAWAPYAGLHGRRSWSQHLFAGVILVDRRGWVLLQERDEHPRIDPDKWGLAGGHLDPGEDFEAGAYRELEEETGVRLDPGTLELWGEFVVDHREPYGTFDRMRVFVAATDLTDDDIECHEGRRIVFVDPERARGLDLTSAAAEIVPAFLDSGTHRRLVDRARQETP